MSENKKFISEVQKLISLGESFYSTENYVDALDCYQQSLNMSRAISHPYLEAMSLLSLGWTYHELGKTEDSNFSNMQACHQKCLDIAYSINNSWLIASALVSLSNYYLEREEYDSSIVYAKKSLAISRDIHNRNIEQNSLLTLRKASEALGKAADWVTEASIAFI